MAGDPTATVKAQWLEALGGLDALTGVQLAYCWPGVDHTRKEAVWFQGARTDYSVHSLKAGRRRRKVTIRFDVIVCVQRDGSSGPDQQALADARAHELWTALDEHIADDEHLNSAALIDVAWVESAELVQGYGDTGVVAQINAVVAFDARIL